MMNERSAYASMVTLCQCNIYNGGRWTDKDRSKVTYNTAERFARYISSVNSAGSQHPPVAVIGMQELLSETNRDAIQNLLARYTGAEWQSIRTAQGIAGSSGIGMFWRSDLVEHLPEKSFGEKALDELDNGFVIKSVGRSFRIIGSEACFNFFTGKFCWNGAILNGRYVTEEDRRQEAASLLDWISSCEQVQPAASVIAVDMNAAVGTSTWQEFNTRFADPSLEHTHNSFWGTWLMDLFGKRLDYLWLSGSGEFVDGPYRSSHFGSDHRAVCATMRLFTPPAELCY